MPGRSVRHQQSHQPQPNDATASSEGVRRLGWDLARFAAHSRRIGWAIDAECPERSHRT